jgi:hypothetical protein
MNELPPLPPIPRDQRKIDSDHLNLLAIFHFVGAGLGLLGILFLLLHFTLIHAAFGDTDQWKSRTHGPAPAFLFDVLKWFYLVIGIWFAGTGVLNLISGFFLWARKHRSFSLAVAGITCLHIPLGTVLGVFTIIILMRDSVRELYEIRARNRENTSISQV